MDRFPRSDSIVQPRAGLQTYMAQVYGWMTVGLLLTAFVAWYAANSAAVMELLFTNRVFNRSDHRAISIGYCVISDDSKAERRCNDDALYALFGADGSYAFQYFHCLYRCFYRQYFRRYCRDVRRNESVRLHHEA